MVPARSQVAVDFLADNPGPSLLHCHMQLHMDYGFMTWCSTPAAVTHESGRYWTSETLPLVKVIFMSL